MVSPGAQVAVATFMSFSLVGSVTDVIDVGVTHLIREPKKCLKFNFVVDKTLNGVINMTTHLGYKRLEKLGTQLDQQVAVIYVDYFLKFMRHQA